MAADSLADATALDERQRSLLHEASHKAFRIERLALVSAIIVMNSLYDELAIPLTFGGIAAIGMIAQWFFMRHAGIDREVESIRLERSARRRVFDRKTILIMVMFAFLGLSSPLIEGNVTLSDAAFTIGIAVVFGFALAFLERSIARRQLMSTHRANRKSHSLS